MLAQGRNAAGRCSWGSSRSALQGLRCLQTSTGTAAESELALPSYIRGGQGSMFPGLPFSNAGVSDLHMPNRQPGMLLNYRSSYPAEVFREIAALGYMPNGTNRDVLELTACPQKLCGHYLKSRQFQVTSFDISSLLQMSQARLETYTIPDVESQAVPEIFKKVPKKSLDAVCFFHTFHMLDTSAMLSELHRILRCPGYLVAAWNDRDLSHPCNQELEDILEAYNPLYSRFLRQREPSLWSSVLTEGDLFRIHKYAAFENHLRVEHADHLVELLGAMAFMNHALPAASPRRASFSQAVHAMVRRHFGSQQPFMLPLETRLYILQRGCEHEVHGSCDCPQQ